MIIVIAPYDFWNGSNLLGKGPRGARNPPARRKGWNSDDPSPPTLSGAVTVLWMAALEDQPTFRSEELITRTTI